jgi:hypothetical protein
LQIDTPYPIPLGTIESFHKQLYAAKDDPTPLVQAALEKAMGLLNSDGLLDSLFGQ